MKVNLDQPYAWKGQSYQPGEVNIPEDMAIALNFQKPKTETKKSEPPKEQPKPEPTTETATETAKK